jgi:hypothetical protein
VNALLLSDAVVVTGIADSRMRAWLRRGLLSNYGRKGRPKVNPDEVLAVAKGRRTHMEGVDWALFADGEWHVVDWTDHYLNLASSKSAAHSWAKARGLTSETRGTHMKSREPYEIRFTGALVVRDTDGVAVISPGSASDDVGEWDEETDPTS